MNKILRIKFGLHTAKVVPPSSIMLFMSYVRVAKGSAIIYLISTYYDPEKVL